MLAISVREALRDAIAAFGAGGPILLESPATPDACFLRFSERARTRVASKFGRCTAVIPAPGANCWRAPLFHTPRNRFKIRALFECYEDGGLLVIEGRVAGCGAYLSLRDAHPAIPTVDLRGGFLLPGFVDTHTHFPQLRVLGGLGHSLLGLAGTLRSARRVPHGGSCLRLSRGP